MVDAGSAVSILVVIAFAVFVAYRIRKANSKRSEGSGGSSTGGGGNSGGQKHHK